MLKRLITGSAILVAIAALVVAFVMNRAGQFRRLEPIALDDCRAVAGAPGAEDITIDRASGTALVSSFDRRAAQAGTPRQARTLAGEGGGAGEVLAKGGIFAYDLGVPGATPRELTRDFAAPLYPHGLSLWSGDEGTFLHVVNHPPDGHRIEIFEWLDGRLEHRETVRGDLLVSPNDVLAVGPRRFYATNDHGHAAGIGRMLEDYLQRPDANVVYFDGAAWTVAATGIAYANGINRSNDGRQVYVAGTTRGRLHVFARDPETGALEAVDTLELDTGADNVEVDRHGRLWLGAHPKLLSFVAHAGDPAEESPSQVLWIDLEQAAGARVRTTFLSLGEDLSGSSVAAPFNGRLLIGSVFEPTFLDCGLPEVTPVTRIPAP